jgi:hypothetical protein
LPSTIGNANLANSTGIGADNGRVHEADALRFPIRLDPVFRPMLLAWGVIGERNAFVGLDGDEVYARFGFFSLRTTLANVERWEISGPYRWWRAIGVRGTWGRPEITFGGSTYGGVALFLRRPMRWWWFARLTAFYATLDDLHGFAGELTRRGIPGRDTRTSA